MIFCDMDGVLVDFDGAFLKKHGVLPYKIPREELWEIVITTPNYWVNLPKMPDADILINYLQKTGFKILTGLPVYGFDKVTALSAVYPKISKISVNRTIFLLMTARIILKNGWLWVVSVFCIPTPLILLTN